jgi:multidrug efflux pump subunit AcrB
MRLPRLAIENHQFTNVFVLLLVLMGTVAFLTMPRYEDPLVSPPGSSVIVIYPGANPVDVEELIIDPLEEALNELEDISVLASSSEDGIGVIGIEFEFGTDVDKKYSDVVQKVNGTRSQLPQDILSLETVQWSISDVNIYQFALVSETASYQQLEKEANRLKKSLERIPLIKRSEIMAFPEQEIRVSINLEKIAQHKIPLSQIIQLLQAANQNIPGGHIDIGAKRFNIQTSGPFDSVEEIGETIIHAGGGKYLRLKDIADITPDYADDAYYARFDGKRCLFITLSQKEGSNIFDVSKQVEQRISEFMEQLGSEIQIKPVFDQSASVASRLNSFFTNLLQGLVLVGIVILLAVGFRASMVVLLAIPLSITIGIGFVDLNGYGLQQMTIAGLVIALGLLVDNAIVVIENISRFMKKGHSRKEAAILGTTQISWAIVSSTATTVLAFVPMIAIQNVTGDFIRSMPATVIYTLSASLLISLILTPYLSSKFLKSTTNVENNFFRRKLDGFIERRYRSVLAFSLKRPAIILALVTVVFISSILLFPLVGVSFFPKAEKPQFVININTPKGTNLTETERAVNYVESVLKQHDQVAHYASNIGHGNPRIYYNIIPLRERSTHGQIFVLLDEYRSNQFRVMVDDLRRRFQNYAGAEIEIKELTQGPMVDAPVAIRILGENLSILERISRDVEQIISDTDGTLNIHNPFSTAKMDLHVAIDRTKAGMLGVPLVEIDRTVRAAVAGMPVSSFRDSEGKEYNIVFRLPFTDKLTLNDLDRIWVTSAIGTQIPLRQLANIEFKESPIIISHYNLVRDATVTADVFADYSVNDVTLKIINELDQYPWPKGYRYSVGGEIESQEESFGGMAKAILVAVIGIFAVLVLQFRSYTQPLIVFSAIPLAIIGSILALLLTGNSFSFTAFVGITSLIGIVVNNSIILVDYTNQLVREGKDILSAIMEAGETRFVPIILTTLTTVGGLLPLTLIGGTLWAPMGWTIIGGLLASTFLTLIVVPVLYKIFTKTA